VVGNQIPNYVENS
jgi:hypothetical protein